MIKPKFSKIYSLPATLNHNDMQSKFQGSNLTQLC